MRSRGFAPPAVIRHGRCLAEGCRSGQTGQSRKMLSSPGDRRFESSPSIGVTARKKDAPPPARTLRPFCTLMFLLSSLEEKNCTTAMDEKTCSNAAGYLWQLTAIHVPQLQRLGPGAPTPLRPGGPAADPSASAQSTAATPARRQYAIGGGIRSPRAAQPWRSCHAPARPESGALPMPGTSFVLH